MTATAEQIIAGLQMSQQDLNNGSRDLQRVLHLSNTIADYARGQKDDGVYNACMVINREARSGNPLMTGFLATRFNVQLIRIIAQLARQAPTIHTGEQQFKEWIKTRWLPHQSL